VLVLLLGGVAGTSLGQGQQPIPQNAEAERLFEQGLSAFEQGNYQRAYERFRLINEYGLTQTTTAALLMSGKALVRMGRYQEALDRLQALLDQYPETTYREEAEKAIEAAQQGVRRGGAPPDTLHMGILLPMGSENVSLSQALFNGIRLAVDEHNGTRRRYVLPPGFEAPADSFDVYDTAQAFGDSSATYGDSVATADGRITVATSTDTMRLDSLQVVTEQVQRPEWIAQMHFRNVGGEGEQVRAAVDSLVQGEGADLIIGPLYSGAARTAGGAAEEAGVPLIAPLANDSSVSAGRRHVFQANPTIPLRGRIMARFAAQGLLTERVAIIYEQGSSVSTRMVRGFRREAERRDVTIPYTLRLESPRQWSRLPSLIEEDSTLTDSVLATGAVYAPVAGRNATGKIQDALVGIGRVYPNAGSNVRILGNAQWHNLTVTKEASVFNTTYTNDFYVQSKRPAVQRFIRRYRLLTGTTPGELAAGERLAYAGYDVARFLLDTLAPPFRDGVDPATLQSAPTYEGLGMRIDFQEGTVNEAMFFQRYRDGQIELLR
jgi:hypothetical protein